MQMLTLVLSLSIPICQMVLTYILYRLIRMLRDWEAHWLSMLTITSIDENGLRLHRDMVNQRLSAGTDAGGTRKAMSLGEGASLSGRSPRTP